MIDRKYKILAVNPCSGNIHTEDDSILFSAKDGALPDTLMFYKERCKELGSDENHLESIDLLINRILDFQRGNNWKIPDTDTPCEIDRCIGGKAL